MKEKIKLFSLGLILILLFLFLSIPFSSEARQGCCSHHGGVCGCRCCDGTPLSAKCAPYYPQCSAPKPTQPTRPQPTIPQQTTPQPVIPSTENQQTNRNPIDSSNLLAEIPKENNGSGFGWLWIMGIGAAGYIFYRLIKRKKEIKS